MTRGRGNGVAHATRRTSPIGADYVGTCMRCGRTGLRLSGPNDCENVAEMSNADALRITLSDDTDTAGYVAIER